MTAPTLPDVDVDQSVLDALQPPCEFRDVPCPHGHVHEDCGDPATWVITLDCGGCEPPLVLLLCDRHNAGLVAARRCKACRTRVACTRERL